MYTENCDENVFFDYVSSILEERKVGVFENLTDTDEASKILYAVLRWSKEQEEKGQPINQIICCSPENSPLSRTLRNTRETIDGEGKSIQCTTVRLRKDLCINHDVRDSSSNEHTTYRCEVLNKGDGCCPFNSDAAVQKLSQDMLNNVFDIEDLHKRGNKNKACPYFAAVRASRGTQLILMSYENLINRSMSKDYSINFKDAIIIIDMADDLEFRKSLHIFYEGIVPYADLRNLIISVDKFNSERRETCDNVEWLDAALLFLKSMSDLMRLGYLTNKPTVLGRHSLKSVISFFKKSDFHDYVNEYPLDVHYYVSFLFFLDSLEESLENKYRNIYGEVEVEVEGEGEQYMDNLEEYKDKYEAIDTFVHSNVQDIPLFSRIYFKSTIEEARSVIFAKSTRRLAKSTELYKLVSLVYPQREDHTELTVPLNFTSHFKIPQHSVLPFLVFSKDFINEEERHRLEMLEHIIRVGRLSNIIPSGIVCFILGAGEFGDKLSSIPDVFRDVDWNKQCNGSLSIEKAIDKMLSSSSKLSGLEMIGMDDVLQDVKEHAISQLHDSLRELNALHSIRIEGLVFPEVIKIVANKLFSKAGRNTNEYTNRAKEISSQLTVLLDNYKRCERAADLQYRNKSLLNEIIDSLGELNISDKMEAIVFEFPKELEAMQNRIERYLQICWNNLKILKENDFDSPTNSEVLEHLCQTICFIENEENECEAICKTTKPAYFHKGLCDVAISLCASYEKQLDNSEPSIQEIFNQISGVQIELENLWIIYEKGNMIRKLITELYEIQSTLKQLISSEADTRSYIITVAERVAELEQCHDELNVADAEIFPNIIRDSAYKLQNWFKVLKKKYKKKTDFRVSGDKVVDKLHKLLKHYRPLLQTDALEQDFKNTINEMDEEISKFWKQLMKFITTFHHTDFSEPKTQILDDILNSLKSQNILKNAFNIEEFDKYKDTIRKKEKAILFGEVDQLLCSDFQFRHDLCRGAFLIGNMSLFTVNRCIAKVIKDEEDYCAVYFMHSESDVSKRIAKQFKRIYINPITEASNIEEVTQRFFEQKMDCSEMY